MLVRTIRAGTDPAYDIDTDADQAGIPEIRLEYH